MKLRKFLNVLLFSMMAICLCFALVGCDGKAKEEGAKTVRVGAQTHAVGFYEKCGFSLIGTPEYLEENIPHYDMILNF